MFKLFTRRLSHPQANFALRQYFKRRRTSFIYNYGSLHQSQLPLGAGITLHYKAEATLFQRLLVDLVILPSRCMYDVSCYMLRNAYNAISGIKTVCMSHCKACFSYVKGEHVQGDGFLKYKRSSFSRIFSSLNIPPKTLYFSTSSQIIH